MSKNQRLLAAYRYFNPYWYEGDYCNPWRDLLAEYRHKRQTRFCFNGADTFAEWLIHEAAESEFCRAHNC
jgi:hypothetical protein